jgi:hypothetical protein
MIVSIIIHCKRNIDWIFITRIKTGFAFSGINDKNTYPNIGANSEILIEPAVARLGSAIYGGLLFFQSTLHFFALKLI